MRDVKVLPCDPAEVSAPIVFSALDAGVAGEVEAAFARAGRLVLSNAKNFRMDQDVPLVIPEVNADHLALLDVQRSNRGWKGGIVTNANCASIMAVMALAPLHEAFGVRRLFVATMQAVSGAGYPGVPSLDILGNVIPFIGGEEGKIETEIQKMLGRRMETHIEHAPITISAHANRVPVENGHTVCLSVDFEKHVDAGRGARGAARLAGRRVRARAAERARAGARRHRRARPPAAAPRRRRRPRHDGHGRSRARGSALRRQARGDGTQHRARRRRRVGAERRAPRRDGAGRTRVIVCKFGGTSVG